MKVINDDCTYVTTILQSDAASEFFVKSEFRLWQVSKGKHTICIMDFTLKYDSIMILSAFANRIMSRVDKAEEIIGSRKDIMKVRVEYAIIYSEDKNIFII